MIRINKIINKNKLFELLLDDRISKIELMGTLNRSMNNEYACKVLLYVKDNNKNPTQNMLKIIDSCTKYKSVKLFGGDNSYLNGIKSQLSLGWLKASQIEKLLDIERRNNINLSISKEIIDLINKYK